MACAMAGAALMDLSFADRIDTDVERLILVDSTPLEDDILDPVLAEVAAAEAVHRARFWVERIAQQGEEIREKALSRLVEHGILEVEENGFLSFMPGVSQARRYPMSDQQVKEEVRLRVMRVLFDNDVPDPNDVVIICLANVCGLFEHLLSPVELEMVQERIEVVSRLDLLGQAIVEAIRQSEPPAGPPPASEDLPRAPRVPLHLILMNSYRDFLAKQYQELGPIFRIQVGGKHAVILAGPEGNQFFSKNDKNHFRSRELWLGFDEQFGATRSTLSMMGEDHFRMRRIKKSGYSSRQGELQVASIIAVARSEIASWPMDKPISALEVGKRLMYSLTAQILAGVSVPEYYDDLSHFFDISFRYMRGQCSKRKLRKRSFQQASKGVDALAAKIIAAHDPETRGDHPPNIIDDMIALHRADPLFLPETDLKSAVTEPLWVPLDTTGHASAFMFYPLLKYPGLWQRAQAEADALFSAGTPTAESILSLDVTRRIMQETLRLYAPITALQRKVSNSFEFCGYKIAAGEPIIVPFSMPHTMEAYFPNPQEFDIDRYKPPRDEHKQTWAYVPYGLGTHRCLGGHLAEFLMMTAMATILHDVELVLDPPNYTLSRWKINLQPTRHPKKSLKFRVVQKRSV